MDLDADDSSGRTGADFDTIFTEDGGAIAIADIDASLIDVDDVNLISLIGDDHQPARRHGGDAGGDDRGDEYHRQLRRWYRCLESDRLRHGRELSTGLAHDHLRQRRAGSGHDRSHRHLSRQRRHRRQQCRHHDRDAHGGQRSGGHGPRCRRQLRWHRRRILIRALPTAAGAVAIADADATLI